MRIQGGQALIGGELVTADIAIDEADGMIAGVGSEGNGRAFDARGYYVLPGIVDIHADAFERQFMPRPGVAFPIDVALMESDRQAVANGITTMFHGVTWSWEPGLRGADNARAVLGAIETLNGQLGADTRCHLRYETYNLSAEHEVAGWLDERRIALLGFNDHMPGRNAPARTRKIAEMAARAGLSNEDFLALVERLRAHEDEVPGSVERLARRASANRVPTLSHDDMTPDQRRWFRDLDCRLCEFPTTAETAAEATEAGDDIVMGAPNVVRGGSHIGWIGAAEMIKRGQCTVLASDYYYPAPLLAAFRLAADEVAPLQQAWAYVAERPARAAGLTDRGTIESGRRADLVIVEAGAGRRPRALATMCQGRFVYLTVPERLS
jgi:alpha-D-ribose 1-methylphosphonate 5-triphosphate diphosphatase